MMQIEQNLTDILSQIRLAEEKAGRASDSVKLVAVSKFHPAQAVVDANSCGQTLFGENRVQEAAAKFDEIRTKNPGIKLELHMIGSLQRNKVKEAVRIASCIQSVDRIELLQEIEKQCEKIGKKIEVLFELHTGEESKAGFESEEALELAISECAAGKFPHIIPKGFMTMAPNTEDTELIRASFVQCRSIRDKMQKKFPQFDFCELSMGMSGDFEIAIAEGATMVRIGTAIFGQRQ